MRPRVFYEIFVRSFADSNGDGIGDLPGITHKLDYLKDLGIEGIWLTPIFSSPSYHKYDCVNYYEIDPVYGTLADFEHLIKEAHRRGIQVILDLVLNHTSSSHPWFLQASLDPSSVYRDFYYWMSPQEIKQKGLGRRRASDDSGVKFPWHNDRNSHSMKYFGMFWSEMPDLNYNSELLKKEVLDIARYWLSKGADGFRLDAAKHLFPFWEAPEKTHDFWCYFKSELIKDFPDVYLVGEVWDAPEVVAPFFKAFDACFNIDLSYDLKKILEAEQDENGMLNKLKTTRTLYRQFKSSFLDALLLSNHDQERIGSALEGNLQKLKLAANIIFTLPGQPYIYYGEEIGMLGKKPDEHIREPFPWGDHSETRWIRKKYNLVDPLKTGDALLAHYKSMIHLLKSSPALYSDHEGLFEPIKSKSYLLVFIRANENQKLLIIHNLSGKVRSYLPDTGFRHVYHSDQLVKMKGDAFLIPAYGLLILSEVLTKENV